MSMFSPLKNNVYARLFAAQIIALLFGFEVLIGELRGEMKRLITLTAAH